MGADKKVSLPPAPTESNSTTGAAEFDSRITSKTSYSLPEDGSPITISTRRRRTEKDIYGHISNKSQTSLLIEYFEGSKSGQTESRRPSVRVKVRPSSKIRSRSSNDHIQISERKATRRTLPTRRNQVSPNIKADEDNQSLNSSRSATGESNLTSKGSGQIEVEITPRRHASPLIPTADNESRIYHNNPSEISSLPDDSFLDGKTQSLDHERLRESMTGRVSITEIKNSRDTRGYSDNLKTSLRPRSHSLSREKIVIQKANEKVRNENSEQRRRKSSCRSRSVSSEKFTQPVVPLKKVPRPCHSETVASGADTSLRNSHLSIKPRDSHSYLSGVSKSSINNPRLLETVEDAIRRLILPELSALKREQSRHMHRDRQGSVTSSSDMSKNSKDDDSNWKKTKLIIPLDVSTGPNVRLIDSESRPRSSAKWLNEENHNGYVEDSSATIFERETSTETIIHDGQRLPYVDTSDPKTRCNLTVTEVGDSIPFSGLKSNRSQEYIDLQNRDGRSYNQNKIVVGSAHGIENAELNRPMPTLNEINLSEITRSSILSAQSEGKNSASKVLTTPIREVPRAIVFPISQNQGRTPVTFQHGVGMLHSNQSRGDISLHSQQIESQVQSLAEYGLENHDRKASIEEPQFKDSTHEEPHNEEIASMHSLQTAYAGADDGSANIHSYQKDHKPEYDKANYFYQNIQEVPPPLKYIPYAYERRGLSPIQSVSGWTESEKESRRDSRLTRSIGSYSSIGRHEMRRQSGLSRKSQDSIGSQKNTNDTSDVRHGCLAESEKTQDHDYWEEQHRENNRNRAMIGESNKVSNPQINFHQAINYASNHQVSYNIDNSNNSDSKITTKGARRAGDAESNIISVEDYSELTGMGEYESQIRDKNNPAVFGREPDIFATIYTTSQNESSKQRENKSYDTTNMRSRLSNPALRNEYEIDETGIIESSEKQKSIIAENASTSAAATDALKNCKTSLAVGQGRSEDDAIQLSRSLEKNQLRERFQENSDLKQMPPIDQDDKAAVNHTNFQMSSSGIPDANDPMPEIGFGHSDSEDLTNPSIRNGVTNEIRRQSEDHWSIHSLSSRKIGKSSNMSGQIHGTVKIEDGDTHSLGEIGVGKALGDKDTNLTDSEEWRRDSLERKRDTLVTNPYENTSPVAADDILDQNLPEIQGFSPTKLSFQTRGISSSRLDGYTSSSPSRSQGTRTPEPSLKNAGVPEGVGSDPFYTPKHQRNISGMSHGMSSPLYDSVTGHGIDRIESRDIVALMDHVRNL